MYNVFKRPMFKLGGQAEQGSGIMSTVEPKQTMRQNPYTGYAIGGRIGYAQAGQVTDPFTYFAPKNIPQVGISQGDREENYFPTSNYSTRGQRLLEKMRSGEGSLGYIPFKETIDLDNILIQEGIITENTPISERLKAREIYKTRGTQGTTEKSVGSTREDLAFATGLGESKITPPPPPPPKKEPKYKETFNLKEQIAK